MRDRALRLFLFVALVAVLGQIAVAAPLEMRNLSLQSRLQLVGKSQVIRGFYSNKSVPLIVDDINRMNVREALPPGSYMLLGGTVPASHRHGDRVEITGTIARPTAAELVGKFRGEQTILRLGGEAGAIRLLTQSTVRQVAAITMAQSQQLVSAASKFRPPHVWTLAHHYALLINGGINPANNWVSFWNDIVADYDVLVGRGYLRSDITIVDAAGGQHSVTNGGHQQPDIAHPVNYSATRNNVKLALNNLAGKMKSGDTLYVFITDHGGSGCICLWGENMPDSEFGTAVNGITKYSQMVFSFDLCHSAGIIPYVQGDKRVEIAACDAGGSAYDSPYGPYGALNWVFLAALTGLGPGSPPGTTPVHADTSGDGWVSMAEIFNYARVKVGEPQTLHYESNTTSPDTTLALPQSCAGVFGDGCFL